MIFCAPYEVRYEVVPVLKDFLESSKPNPMRVSDDEYAALPELMKPIAVIPAMRNIMRNTKVDRNAISARVWLGKAINAYANSTNLLELTKGDEQMALPTDCLLYTSPSPRDA